MTKVDSTCFGHLRRDGIPTSGLVWWPALLSIASAEYGRVFVSNLNDSTVAIVDSATADRDVVPCGAVMEPQRLQHLAVANTRSRA